MEGEDAGGLGVAVGRSSRARRACRTCGQLHAHHEPHMYDYVDEVDEDVTCHICLQPLVTPLDTPCGHTFCRPCILSFMKVQHFCPVDRKPLSQQLCTPSSLVLKKLLEKLKVKCPNVEQCQAEMPRGDLEDHLKYRCPGNWVSCTYSTVGCVYRGTQRNVQTHQLTCVHKDTGVPRPPIVEGEISHIEVPRTHTALGITIVGGADTPLRCVVVQEVFPDGLIAQDGRLQPGDQIIEVDGVDMTSATHHHVCQALRQAQSVLRLGVYRERIEAPRTISPIHSTSPNTSINVANNNVGSSPNNNNTTSSTPQLQSETMAVTLKKESNRQLGLKLGGRRTEPGIFVMDVLEGSVAAQEGHLKPHDRILAINGADVRYARLDHASKLIQQCRHHVALIVSRNPAAPVNLNETAPAEYSHLFKRPDPALPVNHGRTKSAPSTVGLMLRRDLPNKDINKSLGDVTDGIDEDEVDGNIDVGLSASCESLDERSSQISPRIIEPLNRSNGSFGSREQFSGSLGSLSGLEMTNNGSLASMGSPITQSNGSISSGIRGTAEYPPELPPRHRHPVLGRAQSHEQLDPPAHTINNSTDIPCDSSNIDGSVLGSTVGVDTPDGAAHIRSRGRRSRDSSDMTDLVHGFRRTLRIEGAKLQQKTVTISKGPNESLGMRIGGGVGSNEGDTPIYIANINPQGPVGKSKQVKKGDVLLSVNGQSLLGLTHGQAVGLLKATAELAGVTLSLLDGPETFLGPSNFVPSWLYWQKLPRSLHISKSVVLHRASGASLGFSIVGGCDPLRGPEPIHVLFVVQSSPAATDGKLRCGDRLLSVDGHSLESVKHASAVGLLKQAKNRVHLEVVSWLGTEV